VISMKKQRARFNMSQILPIGNISKVSSVWYNFRILILVFFNWNVNLIVRSLADTLMYKLKMFDN